MANKAILVPAFAHSIQDLFILDGQLAVGALGLVELNVAVLAIGPSIANNERFGQDGSFMSFIRFAIERFGIDERVATFSAEEMKLVVVAKAQRGVIQSDVGFALDRSFAMMTPYAEALQVGSQWHQACSSQLCE